MKLGAENVHCEVTPVKEQGTKQDWSREAFRALCRLDKGWSNGEES